MTTDRRTAKKQTPRKNGVASATGPAPFRARIESPAPSDAEIKWKEDGLKGAHRFVIRLWNMVVDLAGKTAGVTGTSKAYPDLRRKLHQVIERMTDAAENGLNFNTAISRVMELLNVYEKLKPEPKTDDEKKALRETAEGVARVIAPLAPFLGEAFWKMLGGTSTVFRAGWPEYDPEAVKEESKVVVIQVNGKVRDKVTVAADTPDSELEKLALASPSVKGGTVVKVIVVKGKLVNVVVRK